MGLHSESSGSGEDGAEMKPGPRERLEQTPGGGVKGSVLSRPSGEPRPTLHSLSCRKQRDSPQTLPVAAAQASGLILTD